MIDWDTCSPPHFFSFMLEQATASAQNVYNGRFSSDHSTSAALGTSIVDTNVVVSTTISVWLTVNSSWAYEFGRVLGGDGVVSSMIANAMAAGNKLPPTASVGKAAVSVVEESPELWPLLQEARAWVRHHRCGHAWVRGGGHAVCGCTRAEHGHAVGTEQRGQAVPHVQRPNEHARWH